MTRNLTAGLVFLKLCEEVAFCLGGNRSSLLSPPRLQVAKAIFLTARGSVMGCKEDSDVVCEWPGEAIIGSPARIDCMIGKASVIVNTSRKARAIFSRMRCMSASKKMSQGHSSDGAHGGSA